MTVGVNGFGPVLFCHATPRDDEEVVLVDSSLERWAEVFGELPERVETVVCGHTHMPFIRLVDRRQVINPGSIGMPYGRPGAIGHYSTTAMFPYIEPSSTLTRPSHRLWPIPITQAGRSGPTTSFDPQPAMPKHLPPSVPGMAVPLEGSRQARPLKLPHRESAETCIIRFHRESGAIEYSTMASLVARWSSMEFQRSATAWVDDALTVRGERRTGPLAEVKIRFWSGVFRVALKSGRAYFKVTNPGQAFEGELLAALGRVDAERVIVPWAIEPREGWSLLPDGGETLSWESERDWLTLISDVAHLQRACTGYCEELSMVPRYPVAAAADEVKHLVADLAARPREDKQHVDEDLAAQCLRGLPRLRERMMVLNQAGGTPTLQPNDVHPGNAVRPLGPGRPSRVFDVGDAVWSHPWAVLHVAGRGIGGANLNDPWPDNSATRRLVDAYTEHWPEIDHSDRAEVLDAADHLGALHRVAPWQRMIAAAGPDEQSARVPRPGYWLAILLTRDQ